MIELMDQAERNRFITRASQHISVIAPAGVGKTHAVVERVLHLARSDQAAEILPRLVVVTYSVRAAQELKLRARARLQQDAEVAASARRAFQQTFFGTIHSYCVRLLDRYGHHIGLPAPVQLVEDADELWQRFLRRAPLQEMTRMTADDLSQLFRFYKIGTLYSLGQKLTPGTSLNLMPLPVLDFGPVLAHRYEGHPSTRKSVEKRQRELEQWQNQWEQGVEWLPFLPHPNMKDEDFIEKWKLAFAPLRQWLRQAALAFGKDLANGFEQYRLEEGVMTYEDQVRQALAVLQHPLVQKELRREKLSVLLDEAQDTDPLQFAVLQNVVGWREEDVPDASQTFCIVGDFQQSIYGPRADTDIYRDVHEKIVGNERGTQSRFQVTFRCDTAILDFVNQVFPQVLHGQNGQCDFVRLVPRPEAGPGQVKRWKCPVPDTTLNTGEASNHEASALAAYLRETGCSGLAVESWKDVVILCPRVDWLNDIRLALLKAGLPCQVHSTREKQSQHPTWAWFSALLWVLAHPDDAFEVAGVLREVFGVSDSAMAHFTQGDGERLRLDRFELQTFADTGELGEALLLLAQLSRKVGSLPLHQAVTLMVDKTQLSARLALLDEDYAVEVEELVLIVGQRAAEGATFAEAAEEFRRMLQQKRDDREGLRDAIQLVTSYKAKGLEWNVVVLPFLFRRIALHKDHYPRVLTGPRGAESIELDGADLEEGMALELKQRDRHLLERLVYVACTRAKQTLLLVNDELVFSETKRGGDWSTADLLKFEEGGENRAIWEGVKDLVPALKIPGNQPKALEQLELVPQPRRLLPPDLVPISVEKARRLAQAFPHRVSPHSLAQPASSFLEYEPEQVEERERGLEQNAGLETPATRYGTWWHELMQEIPWKREREIWQMIFDRHLHPCSQPERAVSEWARLLESPLAEWLALPHLKLQAEIPFLWVRSLDSVVEGIIDLVVHDPVRGEWHVIDWKTNRVAEDGTGRIQAIYSGQISAYEEALKALIPGLEKIQGSLYLTETGEWVSYNRA